MCVFFNRFSRFLCGFTLTYQKSSFGYNTYCLRNIYHRKTRRVYVTVARFVFARRPNVKRPEISPSVSQTTTRCASSIVLGVFIYFHPFSLLKPYDTPRQQHSPVGFASFNSTQAPRGSSVRHGYAVVA